MHRKLVLMSLLAIATLATLTSCDKDEFVKRDRLFYHFSGMNTINIYDNKGVLVEEGRSVNMTLATQAPFSILNVEVFEQKLEPKPEETMYRTINLLRDLVENNYNYQLMANSMEFIFEYNIFDNTVRFSGFNINDEENLLLCLDKLILEAKIHQIEFNENPFYQKLEIRYTLKVENSNIVVGEAVQDFESGTPYNK